MNNKLDTELLFNLKYSEECLYLDSDIIEFISDSFTNNNSKNKKFKILPKKAVAIIKNPKLKQIKDKISNKVNLILNKISENNIDNLVFEFIENIKITNIDKYNDFIKSFYFKLLSEINFFKFYIKFFSIISSVYEQVNNYNIEYFYNLIENKFNYDYYDIINEDSEYFKDMNSEKRINNLYLIKELIKINYFKLSFYDFINNKIVSQTKYISDIYHWFKNTDLNLDQIKDIKMILNNDIQLRDKVLLENLLNNSDNLEVNQENNKIIFKNKIIFNKINEEQPLNNENNIRNNIKINENNIKNNENNIKINENNIKINENNIKNNNIELENNLDEYLFINNSESIEEYININCKDANTKNKFCEFIINKYFNLVPLESNKILLLMKILIKNKILFKSNLSRGLLNLYNINKNKMNSDKLKNLLLFLKNLGITNGLEYLMKLYNIINIL